MAASNDSNDLLKFMNTTTSNIQEALGRQAKGKKVNHRKYIQKHLNQRGPRSTKKSKPSSNSSSMCGIQPIARIMSTPISLVTDSTRQCAQSNQNEYDQLFQLVSQAPVYPIESPPVIYSRPSSVQEEPHYDPEIESLLSEFGVESPSQNSLYGDCSSAASRRGSFTCVGSASTLDNSTLVSTNDGYVLSPPSEFSDFDESNYSSPQNPSPVNSYYPSVSPSPPGSSCYHHNLTASYDCFPTVSTSAVPSRPNGISIPFSVNPSLNELLGLVSTP